MDWRKGQLNIYEEAEMIRIDRTPEKSGRGHPKMAEVR